MFKKSLRITLFLCSLLAGIAQAQVSCPTNPPIQNGPDMVSFCSNYASQRASIYSSTWYYHSNYCMSAYSHCPSSAGGSTGGGSTGGTHSECQSYANAFCGSNQSSGCWQERYNLCRN